MMRTVAYKVYLRNLPRCFAVGESFPALIRLLSVASIMSSEGKRSSYSAVATRVGAIPWLLRVKSLSRKVARKDLSEALTAGCVRESFPLPGSQSVRA